jgi:hypothetical protein
MPPQLTLALAAVLDERARQDKKWGVQNHDIFTWLAILGEEYGETCQAVLNTKFEGVTDLKRVREEAVQTAAVALAMIECIDRSE